jgi:uncharacterized protein
MRVELASLEGSGGKFAQEYQPGELKIDDRVDLPATLSVTGRVTRSNRKVVVTGIFTTKVQVDCDRCLQPVELPVESDFRVELITPEVYENTPTAELDDTDLDLSVFDGEAVDIDELVREQLLLALPLRILCRESCKGLCPVCGSDRNGEACQCKTAEIDPRWGALREFVDGK